jgi:hypothetical protein
MPFTPLVPRSLRRTDPVCAALQKRQSHGRQIIYFELTFSSKLCADLRWKAGELLEVSVGEGSEAGYVRVRPAQTGHSGYMLKMPGNSSSRPRITLSYWGADETKWAQAPCNFKPDQGARTLTVELPWQKRIRAVA